MSFAICGPFSGARRRGSGEAPDRHGHAGLVEAVGVHEPVVAEAVEVADDDERRGQPGRTWPSGPETHTGRTCPADHAGIVASIFLLGRATCRSRSRTVDGSRCCSRCRDRGSGPLGRGASGRRGRGSSRVLGSGEVAAGATPTHGDAVRVDAELGGMCDDPGQRRIGVFRGERELVLRSEAVIDVDDDDPEVRGPWRRGSVRCSGGCRRP